MSSPFGCVLATILLISAYCSAQTIVIDPAPLDGQPSVRLTGGSDSRRGRIQLYHNSEWRGICSYGSFTAANAHVVCRELGFRGVESYSAYDEYGTASEGFWFSNLNCRGNEDSVFACDHGDFDSAGGCWSGYNAGVVCAENVRLVGTGVQPYQGDVEVYHSNQWRAVCSAGWDRVDAYVTCKTLGLGADLTTVPNYGNSQFGTSGSSFWMSNLGCTSDMTHLEACDLPGGWGAASCTESQVAGTECDPPASFVAGETWPDKGTVQLYISSDLTAEALVFSESQAPAHYRTARTLCHSMGLQATYARTSGIEMGRTATTTSNFECFGLEDKLQDCYGFRTNLQAQSISLATYLTCPPVRLSGPTPFVGELQVLNNGAWASVCVEPDAEVANVVCKELFGDNIPSGATTLTTSSFATSTGPDDDFTLQSASRTYDQSLLCSQTSDSVRDCLSGASTAATCATEQALAISCPPPVRMDNSTGQVFGYVSGSWYPFSIYSNFDGAAAQTVCRSLGLPTLGAKALTVSLNSPACGYLSLAKNCFGSEKSPFECGLSYTSNCNSYVAAVTCGLEVRLANGKDQFQGTLQTLKDYSWRGVCADGFNLTDAVVACRGLGSPATLSTVSYTTGADLGNGFWLTNVACSGTEASLLDCPSTSSSVVASCSAGGITLQCPTNSRLEGGLLPFEGMVQVFHDTEWRFVSSLDWQEAQVAARSVGLATDDLQLTTGNDMYSPTDEAPSWWITGPQCTGSETSLHDCSFSGYCSSSCTSNTEYPSGSEAAIRGAPAVRLSTIRSAATGFTAGDLEYFYDGSWRPVCSDGFDAQDASVACYELGYSWVGASATQDGAAIASGTSTWLASLECTGFEEQLLDCPGPNPGTGTCSSGKAAAVTCNIARVGSRSRSQGVVTVANPRTVEDGERYGLSRAFVYPDNLPFSMWGEMAQVMCKAAGLSDTNSRFMLSGKSEYRCGWIWMYSSGCTGDESRLSECSGYASQSTRCGSYSTAGAFCPQVRLVQGTSISSSNSAGDVQVHYQGSWRSVCDQGWDQADGDVVCKALGFPGAASVTTGAHHGSTASSFWTTEMGCNGDEDSLLACPSGGWSASTACSGGGAAGVVCQTARMRLVNASNTDQEVAPDAGGLVQVFTPRGWAFLQSPSDGALGQEEGAVMCAELGVDGAQALAASGSTQRLCSTVRWSSESSVCSVATASSFFDCFEYAADYSCNTVAPVALTCPHVRLVGGEVDSSGDVQVRGVDGVWRALCDEGFGLNEAQVVCSTLGMPPSGATAHTGSTFGSQVLADYASTRFACSTGTEDTLSSCTTVTASCSGTGSVAGVSCVDTVTKFESDTAVVGGVVMLWDTISRTWLPIDASSIQVYELGSTAQVLCRAMGLPTEFAQAIVSDHQQRSNCIRTMPRCQGWEGDIRECENGGYAAVGSTCSSTQVLKVNCRWFAMDTETVDPEAPAAGALLTQDTDGVWRHYCADDADATVVTSVCSSMGFNSTGVMWSTYAGNTYRGLSQFVTKCTVGVSGDSVCNTTVPRSPSCSGALWLDCQAPRVRLVGDYPDRGLVEVRQDRTWYKLRILYEYNGRVLPHLAATLCREAGLPDEFAEATVLNSYSSPSGSDHGFVILGPQQLCPTNMSSVWDCASAYLDEYSYSSNSYSARPVWLSCPRVRLAGGLDDLEGDVYVWAHGEWRPMCDEGFTANDASAVCSSLGFTSDGSRPATVVQSFGTHSTQAAQSLATGAKGYWLQSLSCTGSELSPFDCAGASPATAASCTTVDRVAAVRCQPPVRFASTPTMTPTTASGELEMYVGNGTWATLVSTYGTYPTSVEQQELPVVLGRAMGFVGCYPVLVSSSGVVHCPSSSPFVQLTDIVCPRGGRQLQNCRLDAAMLEAGNCYYVFSRTWVCTSAPQGRLNPQFNSVPGTVRTDEFNVACTTAAKELALWSSMAEGDAISVSCPAGCISGTLDGLGVYHPDSSICLAAYQWLNVDSTGVFVVKLPEEQRSFLSGTRNGVVSNARSEQASSAFALRAKPTPEYGAVRLVNEGTEADRVLGATVNGTRGLEGALQVYAPASGEWKFVCGDNWHDNNNELVCGGSYGSLQVDGSLLGRRMFDFVAPSNAVSLSGYAATSVSCDLDPSAYYALSSCSQTLSPGGCTAGPVALQCGPRTPVQLANPTSGVLQAYSNGKWLYMSSSSSSAPGLARVVCRSLGLPTEGATMYLESVDAGSSSCQSRWAMPSCSGDENALEDCTSGSLSESTSCSNDVVAVFCPTVRLVSDGTGANTTGWGAGDVEIWRDGVWSRICDEGWSDADAAAACGAAGYPTDGAVATAGSAFTQWSTDETGYGMTNVSCASGAASILDDCTFSPSPSYASCNGQHAAGAQCRPRARLVALPTSNGAAVALDQDATEGVLQLYWGRKWVYLAGSNLIFNLWPLAPRLCEELGDFPADGRSSHVFLAASRLVQTDELVLMTNGVVDECDSGSPLSDCIYSVNWVTTGYTVIGLQCPRVQLTGNPLPSTGDVRVYYDGKWNFMCDDVGAPVSETARVACRAAGMDASVSLERSLQTGSPYGSTPHSFFSSVTCTGDEVWPGDCSNSGFDSTCSSGQAAGVDCGLVASDATQIRLLNTTTYVPAAGLTRGLVQVAMNGTWMFITPATVKSFGADRLCEALGLPGDVADVSSVAVSSDAYGSMFAVGDRQVSCAPAPGLRACDLGMMDSVQFTDSGGHLPSEREVALLSCKTVRLQSARASSSAREQGDVSVYVNGVWREVCDSGWDVADATTVCRELGAPTGADVEAHTGAAFGTSVKVGFALADVACTGTEDSLLDCPATGDVGSCNASQVAGVVCASPQRLVDGVVEVFLEEQWNLVRTSIGSTLSTEASVFCAAQGSPFVSHAFAHAFLETPPTGFESGTCDWSWLGSCSGSETSLQDCSYYQSTASSCTSETAWRVGCSPVRLKGGAWEGEGDIEVWTGTVWQPLCADGGTFDANTADAVCRSLGFPGVFSTAQVWSNGQFGTSASSSGFWSSYYSCGAGATDMSQCTVGQHLPVSCSSDTAVAGVRCAPRVRLEVDGAVSTTGVGAPAVYQSGQWYTFYSSAMFDKAQSLALAAVLCRQMGMASAGARFDTVASLSVSGTRWAGTISGRASTQCTGTEQRWQDCSSAGSQEYAMSIGLPPLHCPDVRLQEGPDTQSLFRGDVRLYVAETGEWGAVHELGWGDVDARVACTSVGYSPSGLAATATNGTAFDSAPSVYVASEVACEASTARLGDCSASAGPIDASSSAAAGVECTPTLRLNSTGRLNSYTGVLQWYRNDGWEDMWVPASQSVSEQVARVACRELGLAPDSAEAQMMEGETVVAANSNAFSCTGSELSIQQCSRNSYSGVSSTRVLLRCPEVRLVGGSKTTEGAVQVFHQGEWRHVCASDTWNDAAARAVCHEVGFSTVAGASALEAQGSQFIPSDTSLQADGYWVRSVSCPQSLGAGAGLSACTVVYTESRTECASGTRAAVRCSYIPPPTLMANVTVRLLQDDEVAATAGLVQVKYAGEWRYVCDRDAGAVDAEVACRSLGFDTTSSSFYKSQPGSVYSDSTLSQASDNQNQNLNLNLYWLYGLQCDASKANLFECVSASTIGNVPSDCTASTAWGVECTGPYRTAGEEGILRGPTPVTVALEVQGQTKDSFTEGLVKVTVYDRTLHVCDDGWDATDAGVVCAQLGYLRESAQATSGSLYTLDDTTASGSIPSAFFAMDSVACEGDEASLGDCSFPGWGVQDCDVTQAAGVVCYTGLSYNCSTDPQPHLEAALGRYNSCRADALGSGGESSAVAAQVCSCAQEWAWEVKFVNDSYLGGCDAVESAMAAVASEGSTRGCQLVYDPTRPANRTAAERDEVLSIETAVLAAMHQHYRDRFTSFASSGCDVTRRSYVAVSDLVVQRRLDNGAGATTAMMDAAISTLTDEAEQLECGQLLYCAPGTYQSQTVVGGQTTSACLNCPRGTYQSRYGALSVSECTSCPGGTASAVEGASSDLSCSECPAGTYAPTGSTQCTGCPAGSWSNVTRAPNAAVCQLCPAGSWSSTVGAAALSDCTLCAAGKASATLGAVSSTTCVQCALGRAAESPGLAACYRCPSGHYPSTDRSVCRQCPAEGVLNSATVPTNCDGTCLAGQQPTSDHTDCEQCPPGTYQALDGQGPCEPCPAGQYAEVEGSTSCKDCAADSYTDQRGQSECTSCPNNRRTLSEGADSHKLCVCDDGQYSLDAEYEKECSSCPSGGVCENGWLPYAAVGYWYTLARPEIFYPCNPLESCGGGDLTAARTGRSQRLTLECALVIANESASYETHADCAGLNVTQEDVASDKLCGEGYIDERCATCADEYYRFGESCDPCTDAPGVLVALFVAALLVLGGAAALLLRLGVSLAAITIALDYAQMVSKFARYDVNWSSSSESSMSSYSIVDFDPEFFSPECVSRSFGFLEQWLLVIGLPLAFVSVMFVVQLFMFVGFAAVKCRRLPPRRTARLVGTVLLVLQLMYLTLVTKVMQAFDCSDLPDGNAVLDASPSTLCWESSEHKLLLVLGSIAFLAYVLGIPLLFWLMLRRAQRTAKRIDRELLELEDEALRLEGRREDLLERLWGDAHQRLLEFEDTRRGEGATVGSRPTSALSRAAGRRGDGEEQLGLDAGEAKPEGGAGAGAGDRRNPSPRRSVSPRRGRLVRRDSAYMAANFDPESDPRITTMDSELEGLSERHKALLDRLQLLDLSTGCLYKRYKLVTWYWLLLQLLRKASLVTAYVMLTSRPMVQATMSCIILVLALFLQMVYVPYVPFRKQSSFAEYYGGVAASAEKERRKAAKLAAKKKKKMLKEGGGAEEGVGVGAVTTAAAAAAARHGAVPADVGGPEEEEEEPDLLLPDEEAGLPGLGEQRLQSGQALLVTPAPTVRDGRQDSQRLSPSHRSDDQMVEGGRDTARSHKSPLGHAAAATTAAAEEIDDESDRGSVAGEEAEAEPGEDEGGAIRRPRSFPHQPAYGGEARVPPLRSPSRRAGRGGVEMTAMRSKRSQRSPAEGTGTDTRGGEDRGFPVDAEEGKDVEAGEFAAGSALGGSLLNLGAQQTASSGGTAMESADELLARMKKEARELERMALSERLRRHMHRLFVAAASDPNIMESVSLFGALLLIICGQLYRASTLETTTEDTATTTTDGTESSSSFALSSSTIYSTGVVDVLFGLTLFITTVYMTLLVLEPVIAGPISRCYRRRCGRKEEVHARAGLEPRLQDGRAGQMSEAERRAALLHTMPTASVLRRRITNSLKALHHARGTEPPSAPLSISAGIWMLRQAMCDMPDATSHLAHGYALLHASHALRIVLRPADRVNAIECIRLLLETRECDPDFVRVALDTVSGVISRDRVPLKVLDRALHLLRCAAELELTGLLGEVEDLAQRLIFVLYTFRATEDAVTDAADTLRVLIESDAIPSRGLNSATRVKLVELLHAALGKHRNRPMTCLACVLLLKATLDADANHGAARRALVLKMVTRLADLCSRHKRYSQLVQEAHQLGKRLRRLREEFAARSSRGGNKGREPEGGTEDARDEGEPADEEDADGGEDA